MRRGWLGVALAVAIAGAAFADRVSPPASPLPAVDRAAAPGGVWGCPVIKMPGAAGWLHLANIARDPSTVRISFLPDGKRPVEQALTLRPGRAATVATPASILPLAAAAVVEYAGGRVAVSRTVLLSGTGATGAGAASCSRPEPGTHVTAHGATLRTETQIAILNPGSSDAVVDVALLAGGRRTAPASLHGRVVPARRRLVVRVGDFVFDARAVAATITPRTGRVVSDVVMISPRVLDLMPAVTPERRLVTVASSSRGGVAFSTVTIGDQDASIDAKVLTTDGQTTYQPLAVGLPPDTPLLQGPPATGIPPGPVALAIASRTSPVATGARWSVAGPGGPIEAAASVGAPPSDRLVAVTGPPATTGSLRLLLANPDAVDATVDVTLFTETGETAPPSLQGIRVRSGFTAALALPGLPATATVGILVSARRGTLAAAIEALAQPRTGFSAYAVTAVPILAAPPVSIAPDARLGVPAP